MSAGRKKAREGATAPRLRSGHARQRQRLIEACISALHIYGPSRTTVEKVVAIAKMSPGIVRFYFTSKASMLVASLQFLAAEFEQRLLNPVSKLKSTPVAALELLVDLYLDPDLASPRKVSVWYSFWGEASSRQEYYDICGQKDENFAALVRELIANLIAQAGEPRYDPDAIALGLIGTLEMLWQDFAFKSEEEIDRPQAKRRCIAYLGSIFPGSFGGPGLQISRPPATPAAAIRPSGRSYLDAHLQALERERLFQGAWTVVGHESQVARTGDFISADAGAERVAVVRCGSGALRALRNCCPAAPHALIAGGRGRLEMIECPLHGLRFTLDGRRSAGPPGEDLGVLELANWGGLVIVRPGVMAGPQAKAEAAGHHRPDPALAPQWLKDLRALGEPGELPVGADWKVLVELWLGSIGEFARADPATAADGAGHSSSPDSLLWCGLPAGGSCWSARRYRSLVPGAGGEWRRQFIAPNQLLEARPDGLSVLQAVPSGPGTCVIRRLDYTRLECDRRARAALYLAGRLGPWARKTTLQAAHSMQRGIVDFGYQAPAGSGGAAMAWFRGRLQRVMGES
jgi:TetR/AcrR family transcriptional repressor of bet genes